MHTVISTDITTGERHAHPPLICLLMPGVSSPMSSGGLREDSAKVPNPYPICRMDVLNGIAANKTEEGDIQ